MKKTLAKKPVTTFVGKYFIGSRAMDLYLEPSEYGGSFTISPLSGGLAEIRIGCASWNWPRVLSIILHEALEMVHAADMGHRFIKSSEWANDAAAYWFHFDHTGFGEAVARVGHFLSEALPDVSAQYSKLKKEHSRCQQKSR